MPKILITGNGFDLNLNLPTSYINFIKVLNNLEFLTDYTFEKIYSPCTNFEELKYSFKNSIDFDKSEILNLKSLLKNNLWYKFFKSELNIESWIDFEQKIEYVLRNIFKSLDILKDSVFSSGLFLGRVASVAFLSIMGLS